jgi:hypothetical protein
MITWTITSMESTADAGIVVSANWACVGQQDGFTSGMSGTSVFPAPGQTYTPYADLTESQVLGWCWTVGGVDQTNTEAAVNAGLQSQINPVVVNNPLPWTA